MLVGADWLEWEPEDILAELDATIVRELGSEAAYEANHAYIELRDHWQESKGWIGPLGDEAVRQQMLASIEPQFIQNEVCNEAVDRKVRALHKVPPRVLMPPTDPAGDDGAPSDDQARKAEDLERVIQAWLRRVKASQKTRDALRAQTWASRGLLQVRPTPQAYESTQIPEGVDGEETDQQARALRTDVSDLEEALSLISFQHIETQHGMVHQGEDERETAILTWEEDIEEAGKKRTLIHIELWRVTDTESGTVQLRKIIVEKGQNKRPEDYDETFDLPLDGVLPVSEIRGKLLMTHGARKQQQRLNFYESILVRLGETAGFPERVYINAATEGIWSKTKPSNGIAHSTKEGPDGTWYLIPTQRTLGAGVSTELRGMTYPKNETGEKAITTPTVQRFDPVDPSYAIKAVEHGRSMLLSNMNQGHLAQTSRGESSGEAYEQARADYVDDLEETAEHMERCLEQLITCALAFAKLLGVPESELEGHRVSVQAEVRAGAASAESKRANSEMVEKGLMTKRGAMLSNGVTDPDASLLEIAESEETRLSMIERKAAVAQQLSAAGASIQGAALAAGFAPEEAEAMASRVTQ